MAGGNCLYGKVATRRDFIAVSAPPAFLSVWEPWLHGGISASREALRDRWTEYFLTAPIWRFWLGAEICGTPVLGALMPSMDGVGRYFPLTFAVLADGKDEFAPPEADERTEWFARVEDFLLASLDEKDHEALLRQLSAVPAPTSSPGSASAGDDRLALDASCYTAPAEAGFVDAFARLRAAASADAAASSCFFWTLGGEGFPPRAISSLRLPSPQLFAALLTGGFDRKES
jgi:type VI secretion system protein ImpM